MSCVCQVGSCDNVGGCYVCVSNLGYSLLSGSQMIQQFVAPVTGPYRVIARVTGGNPPSNFTVLLNGNPVASIPGTGGEAIISAQQGNLVQVQASWGVNYLGGQVEVMTCPPQPPSSPPPAPSNNSTLIIGGLVAAIAGLGLLIYKMLKSGRETGS